MRFLLLVSLLVVGCGEGISPSEANWDNAYGDQPGCTAMNVRYATEETFKEFDFNKSRLSSHLVAEGDGYRLSCYNKAMNAYEFNFYFKLEEGVVVSVETGENVLPVF